MTFIIKMGCLIHCNKTAVIYLSETRENQTRILELESRISKVNGKIDPDYEYSNISILFSEIHQSNENLSKMSKLFPKFTSEMNQISSKPTIVAKDYITTKIKATNHLKKICNAFTLLVSKLKKHDLANGIILNSTIESFESIISQGNFEKLVNDISFIKEKQIILSSYRGGELQSLIKRIEEQCELSRWLETIQAKIEAEQYIENLESIYIDSETVTDELMSLIERKNTIEKEFNETKSTVKEKDLKEKEPLKIKKLEIEDKTSELTKEIEKLLETLLEHDKNLNEIEKITLTIKEIQNKTQKQKEKIAKMKKDNETNLKIGKHSEKGRFALFCPCFALFVHRY